MDEQTINAGLFTYTFNVGRDDVIANLSNVGARVTLGGLGTVVIPAGGKVTLSRKGVELEGNWRCRAELKGGHTIIILDSVIDDDAKESEE